MLKMRKESITSISVEEKHKMKNNRLLKFLIITFMITCISWGLLVAVTKLNIVAFSHSIGTLLHMLGGFGPTIATLFVMEEKPSIKSVLRFVFQYEKQTLIYFWILTIMEIAVIGLSSMEFNPALPWYRIPVVFLQAVFLYGGEEELGWRGVMQPILEKKFNFPIATLITGLTWGVWHIPLWLVEGSSQQNMPFLLFVVLGIILSFWLAAIYKKTKCVFACNVFHGLTNTLLSVFIIKLNAALVIGLVAMLIYSMYLWYTENKKCNIN